VWVSVARSLVRGARVLVRAMDRIVGGAVGGALERPASGGQRSAVWESFRTALMRTDNDGRTWHAVALPRGESHDYWTISFPSPGDGVLGDMNGGFYVTHNGARTWTPLGDAHADLREFAMLTAQRGFTSDPSHNQGLLETRDGGRTWHPYMGVRADAVIAISALEPNDVWVLEAGPDFHLLRTANASRTWQRIALGTSFDAEAPFAFLNSNDAYGPGIASTDGGRDWTITR
jgi:photosystem II stability/assembly factor-like uncharacterized protein